MDFRPWGLAPLTPTSPKGQLYLILWSFLASLWGFYIIGKTKGHPFHIYNTSLHLERHKRLCFCVLFSAFRVPVKYFGEIFGGVKNFEGERGIREMKERQWKMSWPVTDSRCLSPGLWRVMLKRTFVTFATASELAGWLQMTVSDRKLSRKRSISSDFLGLSFQEYKSYIFKKMFYDLGG